MDGAVGHYDVRSRWSVGESRKIERGAVALERILTDVAREALGVAVENHDARHWRARIARPWSMFDQCEVTVTLADGDDGGSSTVRVEVTFDASLSRIGMMMWLTTSVVGIPLAWGWRERSVKRARAHGSAMLSRFWRLLDAHAGASVYR